MKKIAILFVAACFMMAPACKKTDKSSNPVTNNPANPYYFKFNLDGVAKNFSSDQPQYVFLNFNYAGGYQNPQGVLFPSVGLEFDWRHKDSLSNDDVLGLAGKTFYFDDTNIHPIITFNTSPTSDEYWSVDTASTAYYVKIDKVVFLKNDVAVGNKLRTYVLTGTCNAALETFYGAKANLSGGDFNFIISCVDK